MRYTLLNRFQGALLGAAIGEILGATYSDRLAYQSTLDRVNHPDPSIWLTVQNWGFQPASSLGQSRVGWGNLAIRQLRHLLQSDSPPDLPLPPFPKPALLPALDPSLSGLAIATLPIALFYHENPDLMQSELQQAMAQWEANWQTSEQLAPEPTIETGQTIGVLLVGYTLSLILREQFSPATLVADFIRYFDLPQTHPLISLLNRLQLDVALSPATTSPVLLALAAFLKTPENYRLSLLQAAQAQVQPSVVCAIVGALSGAYNGKAGLPLDWYSALQRRCSPGFEPVLAESALPSADVSASASAKSFPSAELTSPLLLLWEVHSDRQLLELAYQLFARWSGIYNPMKGVPLSTGASVLAAPQVIRSR